jgi:hypothetical protein
MNHQNLILYPGGCYGTFFEWIFNFLENSDLELPFNADGSSHAFIGNFFCPPEKLFRHISSDNRFKFSRVHPGLFEKVNQFEINFKDTYDKIIQQDVDLLKNHFDKILVLSYDHQSILYYENNQLDKGLLGEETFNKEWLVEGYTKDFLKKIMTKDPVERIRHLIDCEINSVLSPLTIKNLQGWNKDSIYNFDIWELRELLSFYWFTRNDGQISAWNKIKLSNKDLLHISISDLREHFIDTVIRSADYFGITVNSTQFTELKKIHQKWLPLQRQINKDSFCSRIVESLRKEEYFDWSNIALSIIDEAWIQKKLFDYNIGIKCDNLNVFPTNTKDFVPLLENIN